MAKDLIKEFRDEYGVALANARQAEETTKTDAWHALYVAFRDHIKEDCGRLGGELEAIGAGLMAGTQLNEDIFKQIGEVKKRYGELKDEVDSFRANTVHPLKEPCDRAAKLIAEYQGKAASSAKSDGMYGAGIEDKMAEAIVAMPKIRWNDKNGAVEIVETEKSKSAA